MSELDGTHENLGRLGGPSRTGVVGEVDGRGTGWVALVTNEVQEVQLSHDFAGSNWPNTRQLGSIGVLLLLVLYVKEEAPSLCATAQQVSSVAQVDAKPMMCPRS